MRAIGVCICVALAAAALAAGAGGSGGPQLAGIHACPGQPGFACASLRVPLDSSGRVPGALDLAVAMSANAKAPRGVLLDLTGGPGQPGAQFIARASQRFGAVAKQYRLVMIDQRGTGPGALDCPELQGQMGYSDLALPTVGAVQACARAIGPKRAFFGTDDVVRDLDLLRRALGVSRMTIDGTSYGTYVAERYALAYPSHVARLVLDSVVPQDATAQLETDAFPQVARVLRLVCKEHPCQGDPAADLAAVVARDHDGVPLLDTIVLLSVVDPTFRQTADVPLLLHEARLGRSTGLTTLLRGTQLAEDAAGAADLSQGLHASALCGDWRFPWGDSATPLAGRAAALRRYGARLPRSAVWPFDRETASDNGIMRQCLPWPSTPPTPAPRRGAKILAPALLLAGDHDLSTPLPWPRHELTLLPHGRLVIVHGAGHSVQSRSGINAGRDAVRRFLLGNG
jgi:pimeloyl-ACP methyl ester carboxylesterase